MDSKKLKELVSQVAEIRERRLVNGHNRKPRIRTVIEIDELSGEEIETTIIEDSVNETLGWEIVKLKDNVKPCELNCGEMVANQLIERRLCYGPEPHWRTQCKTCGCYKHPDGQGLVEGAHDIAAEYVKFYNRRKRVAKKNQGINEDCQVFEYARDEGSRKKGRWVDDGTGTLKYQE